MGCICIPRLSPPPLPLWRGKRKTYGTCSRRTGRLTTAWKSRWTCVPPPLRVLFATGNDVFWTGRTDGRAMQRIFLAARRGRTSAGGGGGPSHPHPETRTFHRVRWIPSEPRRRRQYRFIRTNRVTVHTVYVCVLGSTAAADTRVRMDVRVSDGMGLTVDCVESRTGREKNRKKKYIYIYVIITMRKKNCHTIAGNTCTLRNSLLRARIRDTFTSVRSKRRHRV